MKEIVAVLAGSATLWLLFPVLFGDQDELITCLKFWVTPDIFSLFRGEYWVDHWTELRLFIWLGCAVAVGYGVYHLF